MIKELLNRLTNRKDELKELDQTIIGDGKAEILGPGTYEDYEKEQESEQSWLEWTRKRLKIDR